MTHNEPPRRVVKGTMRMEGSRPREPASVPAPPQSPLPISYPGQIPPGQYQQRGSYPVQSYVPQQMAFLPAGTRKIPSQTTPATFFNKEDDVFLHRMKVGRMVAMVYPFAVEDSEGVRVSKACEKDKSFSIEPGHFAEVRCYYDESDLKKASRGRDLDAETIPIYCSGINQWGDTYNEAGLGVNTKACKWTKRTEVDRMTPNEAKSISLTNARLMRAAFNVALRQMGNSNSIFLPSNNLLPQEMIEGQLWLPSLPGG